MPFCSTMVRFMVPLLRIALLFSLAFTLSAESFSGKVVGITDGDTVRAKTAKSSEVDVMFE